MRTFIREKKIYCGKSYREVDIFQYTDAQYRATRRTRSKKVRESEPKQKNLNDINARRYFIQLGNLNFGDDPDALHVSATYSPKYLPATVEDAEREATNYLRRISYRREKEGLPPLKYLLITSYTTKRNSDTPVRMTCMWIGTTIPIRSKSSGRPSGTACAFTGGWGRNTPSKPRWGRYSPERGCKSGSSTAEKNLISTAQCAAWTKYAVEVKRMTASWRKKDLERFTESRQRGNAPRR